MLQAGDTAPDFELLDDRGNSTTLDDLLRDGPLLLYFYPADFTPICTREACLFRDAYTELATSGLSVAGVSPDSIDSHAKFRDARDLNYPLLSDPTKSTVKAYGVSGPMGIGVRRATFLIDSSKEIRAAVLADFSLGKHKALIDEALGHSASR